MNVYYNGAVTFNVNLMKLVVSTFAINSIKLLRKKKALKVLPYFVLIQLKRQLPIAVAAKRKFVSCVLNMKTCPIVFLWKQKKN